MTTRQTPVYVYGILAGSRRGRVSPTGVEGSPVRTVEHGDLAALVSDLDGRRAGRGARGARALARARRRVGERDRAAGPVRDRDGGRPRRARAAPRAERRAARRRCWSELAGRVQLTSRATTTRSGCCAAWCRSPAVAALRERVTGLSERPGTTTASAWASSSRPRSSAAARGRCARTRRLEPLAVADARGGQSARGRRLQRSRS